MSCRKTRIIQASDTIRSSDDFLLVSALSGNVVLTLPEITPANDMEAQRFTFKTVNDTANTVKLVPSGTDTIEGIPYFILRRENEFVEIISDGGNWQVIGRTPAATYMQLYSVDTTLDSRNAITLVDASGGNRVITLPSPAGISGARFGVKKFDSSANTVTLKAAGTAKIDGAATFVISAQYGFVEVASDLTNWQIVSKF